MPRIVSLCVDVKLVTKITNANEDEQMGASFNAPAGCTCSEMCHLPYELTGLSESQVKCTNKQSLSCTPKLLTVW